MNYSHILKFNESEHPRRADGEFVDAPSQNLTNQASGGKLAPMKKLTERQRKALSRLLRTDGHMPIERALGQQLERRGVVWFTGHHYERWEWGKVVSRLPVVQLAVSREAAQKLVDISL
jgi:hypothetical protein